MPSPPGVRTEGFPGQRMVVLPRPLLERLARDPLAADLHPTDVGYFPRASGHDVLRPVGSPQFILIYCVGGSGWVETDGQRRPVAPGHLVGLRPTTPHRYGADPEHPWTIYWLHVQGTHTPEAARRLGFSHARSVVRPGLGDPAALWLFDELIRLLDHAVGPADFLLASSVTRHLVARFALARTTVASEDRARPNDAVADRLADVVAFLEQRLSTRVTLAEMAAVARASPSHFSAAFRARYGQAPVDFFIRLRMRRAAGLLDNTPLPVRDVAAAVGFADPLYFSRAFRKVYGASPLAYRLTAKG